MQIPGLPSSRGIGTRLGHGMMTVLAACCLTAGLTQPGFAAAQTAESQDELSSQGRSGAATEVALRALGLLGVNYRWGGSTPDGGLDCSGLVQHVFKDAIGLLLPRRSEEMSRAGETVAIEQLKPGDLVFFNTLRRAFSHVGIYIGNSQFVHAPRAGASVRVESIVSQYWTQRFDGARRVFRVDRASGEGRGVERVLQMRAQREPGATRGVSASADPAPTTPESLSRTVRAADTTYGGPNTMWVN